MLHITNETFQNEVLDSNVPVLVDFFADWCGPCKMLAPIIEELAVELEGKIKVVKLNVDEADIPAKEYSVMSIPTLILFENGKAKNKIVGLRSKEDIIKELDL